MALGSKLGAIGKVVRHLLQVWMCRPLANVRFVATANGGVSYTVTCLNGSVNELSDVHVQQRELVKRCPCMSNKILPFSDVLLLVWKIIKAF